MPVLFVPVLFVPVLFVPVLFVPVRFVPVFFVPVLFVPVLVVATMPVLSMVVVVVFLFVMVSMVVIFMPVFYLLSFDRTHGSTVFFFQTPSANTAVLVATRFTGGSTLLLGGQDVGQCNNTFCTCLYCCRGIQRSNQRIQQITVVLSSD